MPAKKQRCLDCKRPSWGKRCQVHRIEEHNRLQNLAKFQGGYKTSVAIEPKEATVGAWWADAPQDGFTSRCKEHAPRMSRGVAASYRHGGELY